MTRLPDQPLTLSDLRTRRTEILRVAAAYRVSNVRVFGSVARGDARPTSDVDFVVDVPPECRGFAYFGLLEDLRRALESVVGRRVDVVGSGGRYSAEGADVAQRIEREALAL
jgi:uncharacterized protein